MTNPNTIRVVVTGLGTVNPLGLSVEETWDNSLAGISGIGPISRFNAAEAPVRFAGEVKNLDVTAAFPQPFDPLKSGQFLTHAVSPKEAKKFGRFTHLGVIAGIQAYQDSGLADVRKNLAPERLGVNIGVGMGGLPEIQDVYDDYKSKGYRRITPFFIFQSIPNLVSGQLSILLGLKGPNHCNVTACATSAHSIGESFEMIRQGKADVMVAGGAESVICELALGGFASMKALSTRNDSFQSASRPFDLTRDGFVMGEGATVLILERLDQASRRGAKIYGEIVGYGATSDAFHLASPATEGEGAGRAIEQALTDARLNPEQIDYVNAHATSTPVGDLEEARAIARVLSRNRTDALLVSSTKSMMGHLLGAAGATEAMLSLLTLRDQKICPTINLEKLDPALGELNIDFVPGTARDAKVDYVLSNSFGFGSTNGCLIFKRAGI